MILLSSHTSWRKVLFWSDSTCCTGYVSYWKCCWICDVDITQKRHIVVYRHARTFVQTCYTVYFSIWGWRHRDMEASNETFKTPSLELLSDQSLAVGSWHMFWPAKYFDVQCIFQSLISFVISRRSMWGEPFPFLGREVTEFRARGKGSCRLDFQFLIH